MTSLPQVAVRVALGAGIAAGAVGIGMVVQALADDPADVPGIDEAHPHSPSGAPTRTGTSWMGRTLGGVVSWAQTAASQSVRGVESLFGHHAGAADAHAAGDASTPKARAIASWQALHESMSERGMPGLYNEHAGGIPHVSAVWSVGQSIAASLDLATLTGDWSAANAQFARLPAYGQDGAYAPDVGPIHDARYFDDNAWIGLDLMQAYSATKDHSYLDRALGLVPFLASGQQPNGGLLWTDDGNIRPSLNTCSNAPTMELLLRLYSATGRQDLLQSAKRIDTFMDTTLRQSNGLYVDNVGLDGSVDTDTFSYNQGTPIGADVLWYGIDHDPAHLAHAKQTADSALAWLGTGDTLWKQAPAFNAIFFRNLLALDAVAPDPRYRAALQTYVDRGWRDARDPDTGLFTKGGVGSYEAGHPGQLLDQAGWVQMQALLAMPTGAARPDVA